MTSDPLTPHDLDRLAEWVRREGSDARPDVGFIGRLARQISADDAWQLSAERGAPGEPALCARRGDDPREFWVCEVLNAEDDGPSRMETLGAETGARWLWRIYLDAGVIFALERREEDWIVRSTIFDGAHGRLPPFDVVIRLDELFTAPRNVRIKDSEAAIAAAERRGRRMMKTEPRAAAVRFDSATGLLLVEIVGGGKVELTARWIPGLEHADDEQIERVEMDGAGFNLHWPDLDVDIYVPSLFGRPCFSA